MGTAEPSLAACGARFRRAYGTRIFFFCPPAIEMAGYYQWSLRDLVQSIQSTERACTVLAEGQLTVLPP
jgi:hypothetical protein